jgi:hypothetical protein
MFRTKAVEQMKQNILCPVYFSEIPKLFEIINKTAALRTFPNFYTQQSTLFAKK